MLLLYAIHHPHPDKVDKLILHMREFGELVKLQPGIVFVSPMPFSDPEQSTLITIVIWQSRAAFEASWPNVAEAAPSEEWEVKPREVHVCDEVV